MKCTQIGTTLRDRLEESGQVRARVVTKYRMPCSTFMSMSAIHTIYMLYAGVKDVKNEWMLWSGYIHLSLVEGSTQVVRLMIIRI